MKTLGMFAKQPVPGRVKTRLAADWGNERAAALYECFVRDLRERFAVAGEHRVIGFAPNSDEAREWFTDPNWQVWPQPDTDLGGRISAFFKTWCTAEDDRTILIGSDSPSIPAEHLDEAWLLLENHDCVVGPAADGGYWLIGLRGPSGNRTGIFKDIDWSSASVLGQTVQRISEMNLTLGLLPVWYDVDSIDSVSTLRGHLDGFRIAGVEMSLPRTAAFLDQQEDPGGHKP